MTTGIPELCLAIDGGTSNMRARVLRGDAVLATSSRPVGVRNVAIAGRNEPLRQAAADCVGEAIRLAGIRIDDVQLFCASGMLTSNIGLYEVPHVLAPASIDDLAKHVQAASLPDIAPQPIYMIPGIKTIQAAPSLGRLDQLDVLRGEESETFGILEATRQAGPIEVLLPGSHSKLVHIDDRGRIASSYTTIAGEMMQALAEHTILASSIDWPPAGAPVWPAVESGARFARQWGLGRGGFAVRLAHVIVGSDRIYRTWFFVGLVVASDWNELMRWQHGHSGVPLFVAGREPLRSLYARLSEFAAGKSAQALADSVVDGAAARGAIAIARRAIQ